VRFYVHGDRVGILCQTHGETVTGKFGTSNLWDFVALGNGRGAFVTDTQIYTGYDGRIPGVPAC
jgi:hypothetical protein